MLSEMEELSSFLWLNNILLFYMFILFIHSFIDGYWGCFHLLAIVTSASMNVGVQISVRISAFGGNSLRSAYDNSMFHF